MLPAPTEAWHATSTMHRRIAAKHLCDFFKAFYSDTGCVKKQELILQELIEACSRFIAQQ
jgi:S-formylglutathione hydrolase FrmB